MDRNPTRPLLRRPEFLLFLGAQGFGSIGTWMLRMAMDWLVLDLTGSAAAVGTVVALQFLPLLLVGPLGGLVADRHDKRRLVMLTQSASAALAAALAVLTVTGSVTVLHLQLAAVFLGLIGAVDMPARQVLVGEVAGDDELRSAVSLTNALHQGGGLVGPALAGMLIAEVGDGWSFGVTAALCVAVVGLILAIRPSSLHREPPVPRARGQLREGFLYVARRPRLASVVVLGGLMGALGLNGPVVYSAFADAVWDTGARGFGLYNSLAAVGAVVGAVLAARLRRLGPRVVLLGSASFAVAETLVAVMPVHGAYLVSLVLVGAATLFFLTSAATYVQLTAAPAVRGRVLAIYTPALLGGHAMGGLLQGALTEELGVRGGLVVTGGLAFLATTAVAVGLRLATRRRRDVPDDEPDDGVDDPSVPAAPAVDPTPTPTSRPGSPDTAVPAGPAHERKDLG